MLRHMVYKSCQCSADSIGEQLQTSSCTNISTKTVGGHFMEWVSIAEQLHTSLTSPNTMPIVEWNDVKHAATVLWSNGNVFYGVTNHPSLFGSLTYESGLGRC